MHPFLVEGANENAQKRQRLLVVSDAFSFSCPKARGLKSSNLFSFINVSQLQTRINIQKYGLNLERAKKKISMCLTLVHTGVYHLHKLYSQK